jgi:preprotein translocase subunit SecE
MPGTTDDIRPAGLERPWFSSASEGKDVKTGIVDNVKGAPTKARTSLTGWWSDFRTFLTEVRNELKRVTWPSRKEVYATTVVVILTSMFFGIYLFALDAVLATAVNWLFRRMGGV